MLRGDERAADNVVTFYSESAGRYSDAEKLRWYELAARRGSAFGAWHAGNSLYAAGDCKGALAWFRQAHDDAMISEVQSDGKCHLR